MGKYLHAIPLMLVPAIIYIVLALSLGDAGLRSFLATTSFSMTLPSGADWTVTNGYGLVILAAGCLFFEILKSTQPTGSAIAESLIAFLAFAVFLILFLLQAPFGTIEFFLVMVMTALDFLAGVVVMIFMARRDVSFAH